MVRGIQNVTGVTCHISCALQLLAHCAKPLAQSIHEIAAACTTNTQSPSNKLVQELGMFLHLLTQNQGEDQEDLQENNQSIPLDPTILYRILEQEANLNPNDVGDVSLAIHKLMQALGKLGEEWERLLELWVSGGKTRQIIQGVKLSDNTHSQRCYHVRTKYGKWKKMACPFSLLGDFNSIDAALTRTVQPVSLIGYDWEKQSSDAYEQLQLQEDQFAARKVPSSEKLTSEWTTTKSIQLETLPPCFFMNLERFSVNRNGTTILKNPYVLIPLELDVSQYSGLEHSPCPKYQLKGGIVHVSEDSIEDEGHVVSIVNDSMGWVWIDDETYETIDEETAVRLLNGSHDNQERFCCAILVVYIQRDIANTCEEDSTFELLSKLKEIAIKQDQSCDRDGDSPAVNWSQPSSLIGRRLKIRWAQGTFYSGTIESYNPKTRKHKVVYDDGDVRDYVLEQKSIEWL